MAAYVVVPNRRDWEVLERIFAMCGEGAIIVPPDVAEAFRQEGINFEKLHLIDYEYGGYPDFWIELPYDTDHHCRSAFFEACGIPDPMEDEDTFTRAPHEVEM